MGQIWIGDGNDDFLLVFSSEICKGTQKPNWGVVKIPLFRFGLAEMDTVMLVKVFDYNKRGKDDYIGCAKAFKWSSLVNQDAADMKLYDASKSGAKAIRGQLRI